MTTVPEGFTVEGPTQAVEGEEVELVCGASKSVVLLSNIFLAKLKYFYYARYNYTGDSLVWYKQVGREYVELSSLASEDTRIVEVAPSGEAEPGTIIVGRENNNHVFQSLMLARDWCSAM